jgi:hypothetical protein
LTSRTMCKVSVPCLGPPARACTIVLSDVRALLSCLVPSSLLLACTDVPLPCLYPCLSFVSMLACTDVPLPRMYLCLSYVALSACTHVPLPCMYLCLLCTLFLVPLLCMYLCHFPPLVRWALTRPARSCLALSCVLYACIFTACLLGVASLPSGSGRCPHLFSFVLFTFLYYFLCLTKVYLRNLVPPVLFAL